MIELTDGSQFTAAQFRVQNPRVQYGGEFPSSAYLETIGASIVTVTNTPTSTDVNAERDRRLEADFEFQGVMYQRDSTSLQRITGAATLAGFAMGAGAQVGNLRWANPNVDFAWIASDNSVTTMDAQTCFAFGQAAAGVETAIMFAAKATRGLNPIPADYTDDAYWP
jgi:hypothetical protein